MDRHERQMQNNTLTTDTEVSAAHRILTGGGNFLKLGKSKFSKAAAFAVVTLSLAGCGAQATAEETAPPAPTTSVEETPVASETPNYTETPGESEVPPSSENPGAEQIHDDPITPENRAEILAELQFSKDMTPEELAEKFTEVISRWSMAGATEEVVMRQFMEFLDPEEVATEIARGNVDTFATALFGENWEEVAEQNSNIKNYIDTMEQENLASVFRYIDTFESEEIPQYNTLNEEIYYTDVTIVQDEEHPEYGETSVQDETDTTISITFFTEREVNVSATRFRDHDEDVDGRIARFALLFDTSTDTPVITGINLSNPN